jgi:hypothetical protein
LLYRNTDLCNVTAGASCCLLWIGHNRRGYQQRERKETNHCFHALVLSNKGCLVGSKLRGNPHLILLLYIDTEIKNLFPINYAYYVAVVVECLGAMEQSTTK